MGRTSKWLRILLGGKKDPKQCSVAAEKECHSSEVPMMTSKDKEKRRWSIGRSSKDRHPSCEDMSWAAPPTGHRYAENSNSVFDSQQQQQQDKSKHAGAVAAVRLADNNDCIISSYGVTKITAAIRIQALFRGYLARRALRALKALVKLQALVRGFLVRKQADATLYCMRSLIRVQARARANRLSSCNSERVRSSSIQQRQQQHQSHEHRPRKAMEGSNLHEETVAAYTQSRRSFTFQQQDLPEDTAKVVEVDNVKHRRQSAGRRNISASDSSISSAFSPGPNYMSHPSLYSPGPASDELSANLLQDQLNSPMATVKPGRGFNGFTRDTDCRYHIEDYKTSSVQSSPRLCARKNTAAAMSSNGSLTPSRSDYSQGFPHYMANTESSRAKVRSQSAPKQRPPAAEKSSSCGGRKRVPLQETTMQLQSRQSFSGFDAAKEECKSHQNHRKLQGATLSFRDTTTWERFHSFW